MVKRGTTGDGEESNSESKSVTIRWQPDVYAAASIAASQTDTSFNSLVNNAVSNYLTTPAFNAELEAARQRADDAIRKLAGGPE